MTDLDRHILGIDDAETILSRRECRAMREADYDADLICPPGPYEFEAAMTTAKVKLIDDARKAGYAIEATGEDVRIVRYVGKRRRPEGIHLFPDGTALMLGVRLDVARGMRSHADMRRVLGI